MAADIGIVTVLKDKYGAYSAHLVMEFETRGFSHFNSLRNVVNELKDLEGILTVYMYRDP